MDFDFDKYINGITISITGLVIAIIGGVVGYFIKNYLDKKNVAAL